VLNAVLNMATPRRLILWDGRRAVPHRPIRHTFRTPHLTGLAHHRATGFRPSPRNNPPSLPRGPRVVRGAGCGSESLDPPDSRHHRADAHDGCGAAGRRRERTVMRSKRSWAAAATGMAAATVVAVHSAGCGWSARDTHLAGQRVTVPAQAGDGSTRFSHLPEDPFAAQRGTTAADRR
jgi:hypothetical protein